MANQRRHHLLGAVVLVLGAACFADEHSGSQTRRVELRKTGSEWALFREGRPYVIRGVGGAADKNPLPGLGANSFRTWGTDGLKDQLDEAEKLGLSVAVGIWLGHERHGFNYNDADQVAQQYERVRDTITAFQDHPAVLLWGLGNEMEGHDQGKNAAIWSAINNLASLAKKLDPNHPTMTVIGEIGGERVKCIHRLCPDIDVVGINSYAGAATLARRYQQAGGTKPYILTEFGPPGHWEVKKTAWGAPIEPSSTEKAIAYRRAYQQNVAGSDLCLGSYAFYWGQKQETTATWFGMLLTDGTRLAPVVELNTLWTGKKPANWSPVIHGLTVKGESQLEPSAMVRAELIASDPEDDPLKVRWVLQADPLTAGVGGDAEKTPPTFPKSVLDEHGEFAVLRMPDRPGGYRLFAYVTDDHGGAAVANLPLFVKGSHAAGAKAKLPLVVYDESSRKDFPYYPSGWIGNTRSLKVQHDCQTKPHSGKTCFKIEYAAADGWAGVAWQHPDNDFGDRPGGWDLTGAKQLTLWLRGEYGGEQVKIEMGILGADKKFPDTARAKPKEIKLSKEWQKVTIDVKGDLTRIKTGLVLTTVGSQKPTIFYLDDCQYE